MARLSIVTLGSLTATLDGEAIHSFESDKARALLAYLVVEGDRPHRREKLAALLWPEQSDEHAHASLSQALYNLRHALGDRIAATPFFIVTNSTIQTNTQCEVWLDINEFKYLLAACENHAHHRLETCPECARRLEGAADLYQGDFLDGFSISRAIPFDEWVVTTREHLSQQLMTILGRLQAFHEYQGDLSQALRHARRFVDLDPLSDAGQRNLIRLLALDGQRAAALAQYLKYQELLRVELAVEPETETRLLYAHLCQEAEATSLPDRLPAHLTPFIGRQAELAELCALLLESDCRLVSVVGTGGSGKTRLALRAAGMLRYHYSNDVYFVPLSDLASPQSLLPAVTLALGFKVREGSDPQSRLLEFLKGKQVLLILDSFETVLEGAGWLGELLRSSPGVKVLVTTRVRLNIKGEHIFPLGGMSYPEPEKITQVGFDPAGYSAMQLFTSGAQFSRAGMDLGQESSGDIAKICRIVQGMPLGLLLASAWVESYSLAEIAAEIERSLDFLETTWAGVPDRQRSLRATLDYSYRLLTLEEQELFCKLAVFRGGFSRHAAVLVAGATAITLKGLLDKSMLQLQAAGRYAMHDLVRQYSTEKLAQSPGDLTVGRQAHTRYYASALAAWTTGLKSSNQQKILAEMDLEINNARHAWEWAAQTSNLTALEQMLEGIGTYHELRRRYPEGDAACQAALGGLAFQEDPCAENLRGGLQAWQARYCRLLGQVERANELRKASQAALERAKALGVDNRQGQALLGYECGKVAGTIREQVEWFQRAADLYQELADPWRRAGALTYAGELAFRLGSHSQGMKFLQEAVVLSRMVSEPGQLASVLELLAYQTLLLGQWESGTHLMEEAAVNYRASGDPGREALAYLHIGVSLGWTGQFVESRDLLERALPLLHQVGDRFSIAYCVLALGAVQLFSGEYEQAEQNLQAGMEAARNDNYAREIAFILAMQGCLAYVQGRLNQAHTKLKESVERYRLQDAAGELGTALGGLALVELALGRAEAAHLALHEALRIAIETRSHFTSITGWAAMVVLLADAGHWERALEVYSVGQGVPLLANSRWQADIVAPWISAAEKHLPPEVVRAAKARGQERDLFTTAAGLLDKFSM